MTKYREIIRLTGLGFSQRNIMASCGVSQKTVVKVQKRARELNISWPLDESMTDTELQRLMFSKESKVSANKRMPDYDYIRKELLRNGVSQKLLWTEYMEDCRANGEEPLMYSQFCYHLQQDEQKRRATMHINRKPGEQVEVDWAGDPTTIIDPDTGEILKAYIFVGVMTYSQYAYVEAFLDMKQKSWITAHVHMYEFFGGVARILVPDNCKTAVVHNGGWKDQQINETYREMAEHYGTAIIPARIRTPKDKPNAEGTVGNISIWITAALRNEQFFSLAELNRAIREKLEQFNQKLFQKKEGSRLSLFLEDEKPLLAPLPASRFELSDWKTATVQFNQQTLFITGATGCGKTYMACAFGMEACKQYYNTRYVRMPDLLMDLDIARSEGNYRKAMAKYSNPILLILDEWMLLKPTDTEQKDIFELLHRRRKKSSTIFCSQYVFQEWYDQLGGEDSPLADAIIDRIAHDSYQINITSIDAEHDRSMREVYGLDKTLRE